MKNELNRVRFFSVNDMASGMMLDKAEMILKGFDESVQCVDINDVIELYHIRSYINGGLFLDRWTEKEKSAFQITVGKYWGIICRFFNGINDNNFLEYYAALDWGYKHSFWELIGKCKTHERISKEVFKRLLNDSNIWIETILEQEVLVKHYDKILRDHLLNYSKSAVVLLNKYEVKKDYRDKELHLPSSLTKEDKNTILDKYLDQEDANLNYIRLIVTVRDQSSFKASDIIKLKAQRCDEALTKSFFTSDSGRSINMSVKYGILFSETQSEPKEISYDGDIRCLSYSIPYIMEHNDVVSLFRNFQILFDFIDEQNRISLVAKKRTSSLFDIVGVKAEKDYPNTRNFFIENSLADSLIAAYSQVLDKLGFSFDYVIKKVFNIFALAYNIENFSVDLPTPSTTILEKIRFLLPEMETLLKRYKLYVEHGTIDLDLLAISSTPCRIQDIPSGIEKKYVYGIESKIGRIQHLFFSDQPILHYVDPFKGRYRSLFDLLWNEKVPWESLAEFQQDGYQWLMGQGYLALEDGYVRLKNNEEILVFRELYENEVISYWHYTGDSRAVIDKLCEQGHLEFGRTLLSKPEIDYFNYYLNKSEFTNGADLRNKYAHGSHHYGVETMKADYYRLLILLVLLEWKIIDDIILTESAK